VDFVSEWCVADMLEILIVSIFKVNLLPSSPCWYLQYRYTGRWELVRLIQFMLKMESVRSCETKKMLINHKFKCLGMTVTNQSNIYKKLREE